MISINENGVVHIPVGHSLWIIDNLLQKGELNFCNFYKECNAQARQSGVISDSDIDEELCRTSFNQGIERLKYLLKLKKKLDNLLETPGDEKIPHYKKVFRYNKGFESSIFLNPLYSAGDSQHSGMTECKINVADCAKFIDNLLSTGKIYSSQALYEELEKEYCWVEFNVKQDDIVDVKRKGDKKIEKSKLYRDCYSGPQKQSQQLIDDHLIVKDMDDMLISTPCFHYQKEFDYHYTVAGITILNEQGELPELTLYDRFKIYATRYLRSEIRNILAAKEDSIDGECYLSIPEIETITDKIKKITDGIKEKQIASSLKINLNIISTICATKASGWQERYIELLDRIQQELKQHLDSPRSLNYADLLATYAKLLGKYGYDSRTDQNIKDKWFDTICSFYDEMIEIAYEHDSRERQARYLIKYANFLRKESKYSNLEEKYSKAIMIYEQIINKTESIELNHDYAYALRSLSKFYSDYDRIDDAISALTNSLNYIDDTDLNAITDTLMQLSLRYAEYGNYRKVNEVLNEALGKYMMMAKYNKNYYANIANVHIKLLRNIEPERLYPYILRGKTIEKETECLKYIELYEDLRRKKSNTNDKIYAHALRSLSLFYHDLGQVIPDGELRDKAIKTCKEALSIHQSIRNTEGHYNVDIINHLFHLGRVLKSTDLQSNSEDLYESKERIQTALDFYTELYGNMMQSNQYIPFIKKGLADINLALAETYDFLGEKELARERYRKSIELYTELDKNELAKDKYKDLLRKATDLYNLL